MSTFWSAVVLIAVVSVHELAHGLTAVALGMSVRRAGIGVGPAVWRGVIGRTPFEVRTIPCLAWVDVDAAAFRESGRAAQALVLGAGPAASIVLGMGLVFVAGVFAGRALGFAGAVKVGLCSTVVAVTGTAGGLVAFICKCLSGEVRVLVSDVHGVIGVVKGLAEALALWGPEVFVAVGGLVSVAVGLFNLIPLPPLDGGRIVVSVLKGAVSDRYLALFENCAALLVALLVVVVNLKDLIVLVFGGFGV